MPLAGAAKGMNAGSSSSSSEPAEEGFPGLLLPVVKRGRRRIRLWTGYLGAESLSEEEEGEVVESGEDKGSGRGERVGACVCVGWVGGIVLVRVGGLGERELRLRVACAGRGLVEGKFRDVIVVLADDVRENGGAVHRMLALPALLMSS